MKPPPFDYAVPASIEEAVSLLEGYQGEAKVLAGGQSLMALLNMRLARPGLLVDVARIGGLDFIRPQGECLAIGAMTRQRSVELSAEVAELHPLVRAATCEIAHPQNRNQGTVGGSIAHSDPAAEYPALALALEAEMIAVSPAGERSIKAEDFFVTYLTTALEPCELLTEIRFPLLGPGTGWSFKEVARRRGDFAMAGVVATMTKDEGGRISEPRVVLFGVGATPLRARQAEAVIEGERPGEPLFAEAATKAADSIEDPTADVHAPAQYRLDLARVLVARALEEACLRAAA